MEESDKEEECFICMESNNQATIKPCGHKTCKNCAIKVIPSKKCPFCRNEIDSFIEDETNEVIEEPVTTQRRPINNLLIFGLPSNMFNRQFGSSPESSNTRLLPMMHGLLSVSNVANIMSSGENRTGHEIPNPPHVPGVEEHNRHLDVARNMHSVLPRRHIVRIYDNQGNNENVPVHNLVEELLLNNFPNFRINPRGYSHFGI